MVQDEKMLLPCPFCGGAPTVRQAMGETWVVCGSCSATTNSKSRETVAFDLWNRRAPPAQPAAVDEGHRSPDAPCQCFGDSGLQASTYHDTDDKERCDLCGGLVSDDPLPLDEGAAALKPLFTAVDFADDYNKSGRPKRTAKDYLLDSELRAAVAYLRAHLSPTPAAEAASRNNVTSGDEVWVKAKASDVCTSCCGVCIPTIHERDVYTYVHWSSVSLSPTPAADDALRVAVEALEALQNAPLTNTNALVEARSKAFQALAALKAEKK